MCERIHPSHCACFSRFLLPLLSCPVLSCPLLSYPLFFCPLSGAAGSVSLKTSQVCEEPPPGPRARWRQLHSRGWRSVRRGTLFCPCQPEPSAFVHAVTFACFAALWQHCMLHLLLRLTLSTHTHAYKHAHTHTLSFFCFFWGGELLCCAVVGMFAFPAVIALV